MGEVLWATYLIFWQSWPVVEQGVSTGDGGWGTAMSWGREARWTWSVGSTEDGGWKAVGWALSHC